MEFKEINETLAKIASVTEALEDAYIANEGEVTAETEQLEQTSASLKELLANDGVDMLGRWLKAKEDAKKALKAERDYIGRKIKSIDQTIDFIKFKIGEVMAATGQTKIQGALGYSFTATTSTTNTLLQEQMQDAWLEKAQVAARMAGLPDYIDVELKSSVKEIQEWSQAHDGEGSEFLLTETSDTIRFAKPRANKE